MLADPVRIARQLVSRVLDVTVPPVIDAVISRVDINRIVMTQVDLNRIIMTRVDLIPIADYIIDGVDLPAIIRQSSSSLSTAAVRGVRARGVSADDAISRAVDHLIPGRHGNGRAAAASDS